RHQLALLGLWELEADRATRSRRAHTFLSGRQTREVGAKSPRLDHVGRHTADLRRDHMGWLDQVGWELALDIDSHATRPRRPALGYLPPDADADHVMVGVRARGRQGVLLPVALAGEKPLDGGPLGADQLRRDLAASHVPIGPPPYGRRFTPPRRCCDGAESD